MGSHKFCQLLSYILCFLCRLARLLRGCRRRTGCIGSGFGGSIPFLYGLFLTPSGNRSGGSIRIFLLEFLIQGIHIGIVRPFNQLFSLVIGFQLLTVNRMIYSIGSRFNRFFALMNRLNTNIIIFVLSYRPVSLAGDRTGLR